MDFKLKGVHRPDSPLSGCPELHPFTAYGLDNI